MTSKPRRKARTVAVNKDLATAVRVADPHALRLIALNGVHPGAGGCANTDVIGTAQALAGVSLTDEDNTRFIETLDVLAHAYVLGLAVGLKLRGIGGVA